MLNSKTVISGLLSASLGLLSGCASQLNAPDGVQHGMAPSSTGPTPEWYAQKFGLARGVGEALRRDKLALWNQEQGTYTYTIRGQLYAQFHPWEHYLKIRPDNDNSQNNVVKECQWSAKGLLNNTLPEEINPEVAAFCNALIEQLALELNLEPSAEK